MKMMIVDNPTEAGTAIAVTGPVKLCTVHALSTIIVKGHV